MKAKKAVVDVQFNWIFVLFVGGILLTLVAMIMLRQKSSAETATQAKVLQSIAAIITSATVNTGSTQPVPLYGSVVTVSCNKISVGKVTRNYEGLTVFGPKTIKGKQLITQTIGFDVPFHAGNIVLAASDDVRYVFVKGTANPLSELSEQIYESISDKFNKKLVDSAGSIQEEQNYKLRFILFNTDINEVQVNRYSSLKNNDLTILKIIPDGDWGDFHGEINYFKKDNILINTLYYYNREMLLAAIFMDAEDIVAGETKSEYDCVMKNVMARLKVVRDVYKERAAALQSEFPRCKTEYDITETYWNNYNEASTLSDSMSILKERNQNLAKKSCPLIY